MCLFPKLLPNPKYKKNKKNGGNVPEITDERVTRVPVGCQKCMECRKQKATQWRVRMQEEVRENNKAEFVTLTFSNEAISELMGAIAEQNDGVIPDGYELDNAIATIGVRRFLERWRKENGVSVKHWLITELGQGKHWKYQGTENLHIHGIIWSKDKEMIKKHWKQYGHCFIGKYVSERTVNYCMKYVQKVDPLHTEYIPKILCSAGIGSGYMKRLDSKLNKYKEGKTKETYTTRDGSQINLPIYYRNKIYTEQEREKLWIEKLNKQERWVDGQKVNTSTEKGAKAYYDILKIARAKSKRLGYGDDSESWDRLEYELQRRKINLEKRLEKVAKIKKNVDL